MKDERFVTVRERYTNHQTFFFPFLFSLFDLGKEILND